MTYDVFGGTLSLTQSINQPIVRLMKCFATRAEQRHCKSRQGTNLMFSLCLFGSATSRLLSMELHGCLKRDGSHSVVPSQILLHTIGGIVAHHPWSIKLAIRRSRVRLSARHRCVVALGKLFTHVPLSACSIIWYWPNSSDAVWLGS